MADPVLYADQPPPRWWVDLQVAKELDRPLRYIPYIPLSEYYMGYVSLLVKGLLNKKRARPLPPKTLQR